uniref:Uncharacterized protein n=1 Tax=Lotus japonicus TaxID=34305 RepID=I3S1C5_LOTJA|nr:unknown [Lotus japonicus]
MASEKTSSTTASSSSNLRISSEETPATTKYNLEKELARRAILRSHLRRNGRRKIASNNNSAKSLPSRLSKVSLEEDSAE